MRALRRVVTQELLTTPFVASSSLWPVHLLPSGRRWVSSNRSNFWATRIGSMVPEATLYNERYSDPYQLQALDAIG
jgi:hypothetical protein